MLTLAIGGLILASETASPVAHDVYGKWWTHDGNSVIEIVDCGNATPCGRVAWIKDDPRGEDRDDASADPARHDQPILGMTLLEGFERATNGGWIDGSIYNPEDGHTYRAKIHRRDADTLVVKGCVGPICRGMEWSRVTE